MEDLVRPVTREHGLAKGQAIRVGELEFGLGAASKRAPHSSMGSLTSSPTPAEEHDPTTRRQNTTRVAERHPKVGNGCSCFVGLTDISD
jgi:hypothetical protein